MTDTTLARPEPASPQHSDRPRRPGRLHGAAPRAGGPAPVALGTADLHLARRFSFGVTPALASAVKDARFERIGTTASGQPRYKYRGGPAWIRQQLTPASVADPVGDAIDSSWFPHLRLSPRALWDLDQRQDDGAVYIGDVMTELSRWTVSRRVHSTRQLHEVMVDFWSNLLHVPLYANESQFWRVSYDQMIRKYAFTTFEQLLQHSITHPAMGLNLGNAYSSADDLNENLGREVLELHTVGVDAGYTQDDVVTSALIITGYRVDVWNDFDHAYDRHSHARGKVRLVADPIDHPDLVFTRTLSNRTDAAAQADTRAYLSYLAHHPTTARRIARRLCVKFVRDDPSDALVSAVATAWTRSGTAIKPTLLAMVQHPDFAVARGLKVRTPLEDYVAMVRGLGITLRKPGSPYDWDDSDGVAHAYDFVNAMHDQYSELGQAPYDWPEPNGFPEVGAAWASAGRVLTAFDKHGEVATASWPSQGATWLKDSTLLPPLPATLQTVIDTIALRVVGQKAGPRVSAAVAGLVGKPLTATIRKDTTYYGDYGRGTTLATAVAIALLDSPLHLHR
ncbi:DUF1800 domain-containing protein [Nocardioides sp.]|uniref:DUF1800 domain-containing protein n=1 Tax=Nocardioides sp. TaxID=35761 RepID=UPI0037836BDC